MGLLPYLEFFEDDIRRHGDDERLTAPRTGFCRARLLTVCSLRRSP